MTNVLVASNGSALLLKTLMAPEQRSGLVVIRCVPIPSSLYASAKTLLQVRNEPVALVLDANSTEPMMAARARDEAAEVIGVSADASTFRILVAVPALEALLFRRRAAVCRAYGNATPEWIELGLVSPGDAFRKMSGPADRSVAATAMIAHLDAADIASLREESPVAELLDFLGERKDAGVEVAVSSSP